MARSGLLIVIWYSEVVPFHSIALVRFESWWGLVEVEVEMFVPHSACLESWDGKKSCCSQFTPRFLAENLVHRTSPEFSTNVPAIFRRSMSWAECLPTYHQTQLSLK